MRKKNFYPNLEDNYYEVYISDIGEIIITIYNPEPRFLILSKKLSQTIKEKLGRKIKIHDKGGTKKHGRI